MKTSRLISLRCARAIYNELRRGSLYRGECRVTHLEGIIDALRTGFDHPRPPYQPQAYGDEAMQDAYRVGFACR